MDTSDKSSSPIEHKHSLSPENTPLVPVKSPPDEHTSFPLAAQIPVKSFTLPTFPPEASHLRELTLTSDIPLPDYQPLVTNGAQYELPQLPQSITHLTLELFSLGFPGRNPHFLTNLARSLPNLKSITFFSCLIDGLTDPSRSDAEQFFSPRLTPHLREIHIIDSFVRPGFWSTILKPWSDRASELAVANATRIDSIRVVEVSYTYRGHEDSSFLARLHGEELPLLLQPHIVGFGAGLVEVRPEEIPDLSSPEASVDGADGNNLRESKIKEVAAGILPFASDSRATSALKTHFSSLKAGDLADLKVLNLSMWTLTTSDLKHIFDKLSTTTTITATSVTEGEQDQGIIAITLSLLLTDTWLSDLLSVFSSSPSPFSHLVSLEIIGVPAHPKTKGEDWRTGEGLLLESHRNQIQQLGETCPKLEKVEMSILKARKAGRVVWVRGEGATKEGGEWALQKQ
jgi:hypothetical protein